MTLYGIRWKTLFLEAVLFLLCAVGVVVTAVAGEDGIAEWSVGDSADRSVLDFPILFAKQYNYQGLHIYDTFYQWHPGGGIYVLENPADPPEQHRVRAVIDPTTPETLGEGIYFDPSLSYDATRLLFCFKGSPEGNSTIYEIGVDGHGLRQLTNLDAEGNPYLGSGGGHHDVRPCYLPDGRIVFTSTRYSGLVPCANNGVAILHVMNVDGSDIHTISVNNVTEFDPSVMPDGRILYGRWEYIDKNALTIQSLWSVLPDGTNETAVYANDMVFPEAILQAKPVPGCTNLLVGTFAPHNAPPRGTIAMIDLLKVDRRKGDGKNDESAIFNFEYPDSPTWDRGQSCDPWAINESIVMYSGMIRPKDNTTPPTNPGAAMRPGNPDQASGTFNQILLGDRSGKTIVIYGDPTIDIHHPTPLLPRPFPVQTVDQTDRSQITGKFFVNNVYAGLGDAVPRGKVRWLRVLEETSRVSASPGSNGLNQTFSISAAMAWSPKIYHGIVPVEEDGSVYFEAPSGRAIYFQLLDDDYRLVRSMRTFVQASPGTTRSCTGCHEYNPTPSSTPVTLAGREPQQLIPESWGDGYMDFPSMIQPILDAKCVECHGGGGGIAGGLDLSGAPSAIFSIGYDNLTSRRQTQYQVDLISGICCMNGTAFWSCKIFAPYSHGSGNAPLTDILLSDPHRSVVDLTDRERELIFAWIDSNGLYYGTWNYTKAGPIVNAWNEARGDLLGVMKEAGCAECHGDAAGNIHRFENDWINLQRPEMSRILRAPMAGSAEHPGWIQHGTSENGFGLGICRHEKVDSNYRRLGILSGGLYEHSVKELQMFPTQEWKKWEYPSESVVSFASTGDPHYVKMLGIIRAAAERAYADPRIDMISASDQTDDCVIAGRSRQIIPQLLPDATPSLQVSVNRDGIVRLSWERSAATIGLVTEIHRGDRPGFPLTDATQLAATELFAYIDRTAPPGEACYAIRFVSDPARTCGTCGSGGVIQYTLPGDIFLENVPIAVPVQRSIVERCPLSTFEPLRGPATYVEVEIPQPMRPESAIDLCATPSPGAVTLSWNHPAVEVIGVAGFTVDSSDMPRFAVYRHIGEAEELLTPEPIAAIGWRDTTCPEGETCTWRVETVSPRGLRSTTSPTVSAIAIPVTRVTLLDAPLRDSFDAMVRSETGESVTVRGAFYMPGMAADRSPFVPAATVSADTDGEASADAGALDLRAGGHVTFPRRAEFQPDGSFAVEFDVKFTEPGEMPLVICDGVWQQSGWFVQKLGGAWRFHFYGIDCDGGHPEIGRWLHVRAAYDRGVLTVYENGQKVGETRGVPNRALWRGDLFIGQYSQPSPAYQLRGLIRNVKLHNHTSPAPL